MSVETVLKVEGVSKKFGTVEALNHVSLEVNAGEIYCLIGPNSSGKTTLIKNIVGLIRLDKGKIRVVKTDALKKPIESRSLIGYMPDNPETYGYLTGWEFLRMTAGLKNENSDWPKKIDKLVEAFGIKTVLSQKQANYSRGNLQKTAFLAAILGNPRLLLIDEPIVGLDPTSIDVFEDYLRSFTAIGGGVFLATHTLDFAEKVADRVGILKMGKLVCEKELTTRTNLNELYKREIL